MTFQIPTDLETTIRAAVQGGRFSSVDEAMTEAVRLLVREIGTTPSTASDFQEEAPDLLLGSMRDHADLMDEIVADIYRQRRADTGRDIDVE